MTFLTPKNADPFYLARRMKTPIWVYDTDKQCIAYANAAACKLWGAENEACLKVRNLGKDMSLTVEERLRQYQTDFLMKDAEFIETWTLYPNGVPTSVDLMFSGFTMPDERMAMLCEVFGYSMETTETLRSTKALLHTDVNIALFNLQGQPIYKNPAAWNLLLSDDSTLEELYYSPQDYAASKACWEAHGESRKVTKIKTMQGVKWFDLSVKQCRDPKGGDSALLVTALDVNDLKDVEKAMKAAKEAAESANIAKSEFLANMSHEIRTPMNGVLGMVDVLSRSGLNERQKHCVEVISQSGRNLLSIINDILDLSKIEAGKVSLSLERCNLEETVRNTSHLFMTMAATKHLSFTLEYCEKLPNNFIADSNRVQQILSNLIGNAVKFTKEGSVKIRAYGEVVDGICRFCVDIEDTGIGIAQDKLAVIFEKFSQAESSTTRQFGGTGLGLTIAKSLAVAMGGSLDVSSQLGKGTKFKLKLPLPVCGREAKGENSVTMKYASQNMGACCVSNADEREVNPLSNNFDFLIQDYEISRESFRHL